MTILRRRAVLMGSTAVALGAPAIVSAQNLANTKQELFEQPVE